MCTCSSLLTMNILQFIAIFMTICEGKTNFLPNIDKNYCPFIETLSFGSDINVKCNNSYLTFNEINNQESNWKFVNQTSSCNQKSRQQGFINQCGINRIDSNYLKVPLKSLESNEQACSYCRINYKSIAPSITAARSDESQYPFYIFNITATGLGSTESFEILWAKRVHNVIRHSYNYWFLQGCVDPIVNILVNSSHTIIFAVDDVDINRVEFIIRRCNNTCRTYDKCQDKQFLKNIDPNYLQTPDSIEKISCDSHCLNGISQSSIPIITHRPRAVSSTSSTTIKTPLISEQKIKLIILVILIGLLLITTLSVFIRWVLCKSKERKHVYAKTSNVDPEEHK